MKNNIKHYPKIFYFLAPFLSILFTLIALELCLRVFYPIMFSIEGNIFFIPDPFTGYRFKPNTTSYYHNNNIPAVVNSRGHRDDEITFEKGDDVFRILVLGDSFTVGSNILQEEAYPQILEGLLNKESKKKYEVVNAGVGGWEPFQYAQYYSYYGKQLNPDLILIGFFVGNDTYNHYTEVGETMTAVMGRLVQREGEEGEGEEGEGEEGEGEQDRFIALKVFLYEKFHLARLILNRGNAAKSDRENTFDRDNCEDFTDFYISIQHTRVNNHLRRGKHLYDRAQNSIYQISRIRDDAKDSSIPLVVVLIPDELQINPTVQKMIVDDAMRNRYDFKMPQSMLVEMSRDIGVGTIDLLPAFIKDPRCLYMNDTHWTPEGHQLAASIIYEEMFDCLKDDDSDGIANNFDNCPTISNSNQKDIDEDLTGDICDRCIDTDGDGYGNAGFSNTCIDDNCPYAFNPDQADGDEDGIGDLCEPLGFEEHVLEAEQADTTVSPLEVANDTNASQEKYLYAPNGSGNQYTPGPIMATYTVTISQAGAYILRGQIRAPNAQDDSFFVQIDSGLDNLWEVATGDSWHWDEVNNRDGGTDPVKFRLTEGMHTIKVKLREDGTQLDKLVLTNNSIAFLTPDKGMLDEAISEYKEAIAINPQLKQVRDNLKRVYRFQLKVDTTISKYKEDLDVNPDNPRALLNLGSAYASKGEWDMAITAYEKALTINPNYAMAYNNLGSAYFAQGENDKSIPAYEKALALDPDYGQAHYNVSAAYFNKGNYKLAIRHCDRAQELGMPISSQFLLDLQLHR